MLIKRLFLAVGFCLLLTGMRNPFQPPPDNCQLAKLADWHFRGVVESDRVIGLLVDASGRWLRVTSGEKLASGWRVLSISDDEIEITTGEGCTPSRWRWEREGVQHAKMDSEPRALLPVERIRADAESYHVNR